jgi:hypothetical protein
MRYQIYEAKSVKHDAQQRVGIISLFRSFYYSAKGGRSLERPPDLCLSAGAFAVIIKVQFDSVFLVKPGDCYCAKVGQNSV